MIPSLPVVLLLSSVVLAQAALPSADVRVSAIPVHLVDGALHGPPMVRGHAPSAQHPHGTVYVYATDIPDGDETKARPYVFEWDVASGVVLHHATGPAGFVLPSGGLDFDGQRVVTLDREPGRTTLTVRDEQLQPQRTRVVVAEQVTLGGNRILLSHAHQDKASLPSLDLELLDDGAQPLARRTFVAPPRRELDPQQVGHAGDAFYALQADPRTQRTFVVRLDETTLRERSRVLVGAARRTSLHVVDDRVLVATDQELLELDLGLKRVKTTRGHVPDRFAWSKAQVLASSGPGDAGPALAMTTCTPLWMDQQAVYACRGLVDFTMVRPGPRLLPRLAF